MKKRLQQVKPYNPMPAYKEKRVRQSEIFQLLLLDNLYSQTGSEKIIFQGGTALRWVYGGVRFSEDLDFVSTLPKRKIEIIIYDIWWIVTQLNTAPDWTNTQKKLSMYKTAFVPARDPDYFRDKASVSEIVEALESDLPRFLPGNILAEYRRNKYQPFIQTVKQVTVSLLDQGLRVYLKNVRRKVDP